MAEGAPLLREYVGKTCIEGSNPSDSANSTLNEAPLWGFFHGRSLSREEGALLQRRRVREAQSEILDVGQPKSRRITELTQGNPMKLLTTAFVSACLAAAAGNAVAAGDTHKASSMTAQECKAWMETSKPTPKDAETARKEKACMDVMNKKGAATKSDAPKDKDLVKEEPESLKK